MTRPLLRRLKLPVLALAVAGAAAGFSACGSEGIQIAKSSPYYHGAFLFAEHCSGCHTFDVAGTQGGATERNSRERVDGPDFDQRIESVGTVLFALRNGGYSGAIMPQNILTGDDALAVAKFIAKYSGSKRDQAPAPGGTPTPTATTATTGG